MAEISVVVPVYNSERYLPRCIDSILAQTFSDFELILVDDGSTDKSGEICDSYAGSDPRISVIHQNNLGQAAAKNTGIDRAYKNGNEGWIAFIDSDDWISSDYLFRLLDSARRGGVKMALCDLKETKETFSDVPNDDDAFVVYSPEQMWLANRLVATIPVCKLCSKRVFSGYRFPVGKVHEDEFLLYRVLFDCENVAYINRPMYYYFQNPEGISLGKKWTPDRADSLDAFLQQCRFFHKNGYYEAENLSASGLYVGCVEVLNHMLADYPEQKREIRRFRALLRRTRRRYRRVLDEKEAGGRKTYEWLAHPVWKKLRKKYKKALIRIRRTVNG